MSFESELQSQFAPLHKRIKALEAENDALRAADRVHASVARVREPRLASMREALQQIRDFPYIGENAAQQMTLIAGAALTRPDLCTGSSALSSPAASTPAQRPRE